MNDATAIDVGERIGKKRARQANNTSCNWCRKQKGKCDGEHPCGTCRRKDQECVYSERDANVTAKRQKLNPPGLDDALTEQSLEYYERIFNTFIRPVCRVSPCRYSGAKDELFEREVMIALAARAVGHQSVAARSYTNARSLVGELACTFTIRAVSGFFYLAVYCAGDDNNMSRHFNAIAGSLLRGVRNPGQDGEVLKSSIQWHATCYQPVSGTTEGDFALERDPLRVMLQSAMARFPRESEFQDLSLQLHMLERAPLYDRTNNFWSVEYSKMSLKALERAARAFQAETEQEADDATHKAISLPIATSIVIAQLGVCAAGGLVLLGKHYCCRAWEMVKMVPRELWGFSHRYIIANVSHIAHFAWLYQIHPLQGDGSVNDFLLDVRDLIGPPTASFDEQLVKTLTKAIDGRYQPEMLGATRPDDAISLAWLEADDAPTEVVSFMGVGTNDDGLTRLLNHVYPGYGRDVAFALNIVDLAPVSLEIADVDVLNAEGPLNMSL